MADKSSASSFAKESSYPIFTLSSLGFGPVSDKPTAPEAATAEAKVGKPLLPSPPCVEVLLSEESSTSVKSSIEPVAINDDLTLMKGRVNTCDVFGMANLDLVPGKYEGGLKLWEGSIDLVRSLYSDVREGRLEMRGTHVLELGCGHGLPGIFAALEDAASIHFQDFNAEVLRCLTLPNVKANLWKDLNHSKSEDHVYPDIRFFAGDWNEVHKLLPYCHNYSQDKATEIGSEKRGNDGYDMILMAETVYALSSFHSLYGIIKKALRRPSGVIYLAGKKHYFGVGGGTRQFLHLVEEDGIMDAILLAEVADGSSNVREVWKFSFK